MFSMVAATPATEASAYAERRRNPFLERERVCRVRQADAGADQPQRVRRVLEQDTAETGPDDPADLPRLARERHVPTNRARTREVRREGRVNRAVQALADREQRHGSAHHGCGRSGLVSQPGEQHDQLGGCPDRPHDGEQAHAAATLDQLRDRQLGKRDHEGGDDPEDADAALRHMCLVLRERRQELDHDRHRRRHEDRVQQDDAHEHAIADDGCIGPGGTLVRRLR